MSDVEQIWGLYWRRSSFPRPLFPILYPHGQHYTEEHRALTGMGGFWFSYSFTQRALSQVRAKVSLTRLVLARLGRSREGQERVRKEYGIIQMGRGRSVSNSKRYLWWRMWWEALQGPLGAGRIPNLGLWGKWQDLHSEQWGLDSGWDLKLCCLDDSTVHQYGAEAGSG